MLKSKFLFILLGTSLLSVAHMGTAMAFEDEDARRAILELRSQLKLAESSRVDLAQQIQTLQKQVVQLRGQLESIGNQVNPNATDSNGVPNPQVGDPNEQRAYDDALNLFRQGSYADSANALAQFANQYPNSPLTPSALFYEGSSHYANRNFKEAISGLRDMLARYPNDAKSGDAMLVIAGCQLELNDIKGAKATLQQVVKQYPDSPASDTAKERLKMFK